MKKMVLLISAFCFLAFTGLCLAQSNEDGSGLNMTELKQDSTTNASENVQLYSAGEDWGLNSFFFGEAVKFAAPKPGWNLKQIKVLGWNYYNETSMAVPSPSNFLVEVRDADLNLLYRLADTQNAYFTDKVPVLRAINIPPLPVTETFYIVFYDRSIMKIGVEVENGTGNSYVYDSINNRMIPAEFRIEESNATKVNWIIRAVGE
ncbi:MAG TPA: hypothetical protein PKG66_04560 [Methanothrix sp.]|nr:hypothetical protein [Methanothrix sp.]